MPYRQTATPCVVRLVALRGLSPARLAQCQAVRAEAGRLWTDLVRLHSQSVQALCQKFAANMETATNSAGRSWLKADPSRRRIRTTSKSTRW